jgi:uncharacterized protein
MANALADETSPYLRQHAENPVDWLPWGPLAFERARELDRPLIVSIGYSACHWCHVMEHESFADEETASLMNDGFVCVKVDREERPDVDALYMEAVQALTGHGGWPLNVFLTPDQVPFYGGTYFPPESRQGMPAWTQVVNAVAEAWRERRDQVVGEGERLREHLSRGALLESSNLSIERDSLDTALDGLRAAFDPDNAGFGGAPKFPHASAIELLLLLGANDPGDRTPNATGPSDERAPSRMTARARDMGLQTLRAMARGGIYDQLGGGFHRYSVDASWTVPHFEKMLYDQALLARAYVHAWQASGEPRLAEVAKHTLDWALRDMRGPENGFYSALDADSEGVEGRYYVWTIEQIEDALDPEHAERAIAWLGLSAEGNFVDQHHPEPGLCVLSARGRIPDEAVRERIHEGLLHARERRTKPALDTKRIAAWNALMITALADAGASFGGEVGPRYTDAAIACADFLLRELRDRDGRLLRVHDGEHARIGAFLEDHAFLLEALLVLFETTCEARWFEEAVALADAIIAKFADDERGGFYTTATDAEGLIVRRKDFEDTPIPSGASSAAMGLQRLGQLTGNKEYEQSAEATLRLLSPLAYRYPTAFGHTLQAIHWRLAPARPIACEVPFTAATE